MSDKQKKSVKLSDGIVKQNIVLMSGLFAAPVIAAANTIEAAAAICVAFTFITLLSVSICYFLPRKIVFAVRIALYAIVSAAVYIPVMLLIDSMFTVNTITSVGIYFPVMISNPLVLSKTESRFYLRSFKYMLKDLVGFILGFDFACLLIGSIRDILINNTLGNMRVNLPFQIPALSTFFGGFILVGVTAGIFRAIYNKVKSLRAQNGGKD